MLNRMKAWIELLKIGNSRSALKITNDYFRGNVLDVLDKEGFFAYLEEKRSFKAIKTNFNYTDDRYLVDLLDALESDNTITRNNGVYFTPEPVQYEKVRPSFFNESIMELMDDYARFIPSRLKGNFFDFSTGFNLFNWDDTLGLKMYEQIRKAAFAFVNPFKSPCKLLDVGCGNGWGTAAIWLYYYNRSYFTTLSQVELYGMELDKGLLSIANDEFPRLLKTHQDISDKELRDLSKHFPVFTHGDICDIPYPDETFDYVFVSQVFHWTDPLLAFKELFRVLKKGGIAFGTENFIPDANLYTNLHVKVIEGAHGFFTKENTIKWAKLAGFKKIKFATPATIFKFEKK
jgi:ubiquinone/menaquinone biosynthesis C-methylase UbiE